MCKVTIHELKKAKKPYSKPGEDWVLFIMEAVISVDGNTKTDVRTVKTFEQEIFQQINALPAGQTLTFEADKKPDGAVFEYTLKKDKSGGRKTEDGGRRTGGQTNRQAALQMAYENAKMQAASTGDVPTIPEIIGNAEKLLAWLEVSPAAAPSQGKGGAK